jgi:transcription elongation factor S-II
MNSTRTHVLAKLADILTLPGDHTIPYNMEKSIYNWAIRRSKKLSDPPSWESETFKMRYKSRYASIMYNLKNCEKFREDIINETIKSTFVGHMTATGMQPDGIHALAIKKREEEATKKLKFKMAEMEEDYVGLFTCGKCKSKKTTYYQMQTRSADEPMTTFVTCINCDKRWKC